MLPLLFVALSLPPIPRTPGTPQQGPVADGGRPTPAVLVHDLDHGYLAGRDRSGYDALRHLPVGEDGAFLSLGVLARYEYEGWDDRNFGTPPGHFEQHSTRANLYAGLTLPGRGRLFAAIKHGDVLNGDAEPLPPVEVDPVDLHMLFAELHLGEAAGRDATDVLLRVGRQELHYGSGRFVSIREGPNVREDFDGVLLRTRLRDGSVTDVLGFFEVPGEKGGFDNDANYSEGLWGVYHSRPAGELAGRPLMLDAYYLGYRFEDSVFASVTGDEVRHSFMLRPWLAPPPGPPGSPGWGGDVELGVQVGDVADQDVLAWQVVGHVQHTFDATWRPTLRLRFGYTSGDDDPNDGTLGTYRAPHPPGRFFGDPVSLGPGNLMGFQPEFDLRPGDDLTLSGGARLFWRASTDDAVYTRANVPLRGAAGDDRYLGTNLYLLARYRLNPETTLSVAGGYFSDGPYLDDNPPSEETLYGAAEIVYRF